MSKTTISAYAIREFVEECVRKGLVAEDLKVQMTKEMMTATRKKLAALSDGSDPSFELKSHYFSQQKDVTIFSLEEEQVLAKYVYLTQVR